MKCYTVVIKKWGITMSNKPVKHFFTKLFSSTEKKSVNPAVTEKNEFRKVSILENVEKKDGVVMEDLLSFKDSLRILIKHPERMSKLDKIHTRIIEISDFTRTPAFEDMVINRPAEVQKLRDELDELVSIANNV
jgi:hypothetical protein